MRCKLRPELAADAQQTAWSKCRLKSSQVKSVYFNHPSQGVIMGPRYKAAPPTSQQRTKIPSEASEEPSDTVIHFYFLFLPHSQESSTLGQSQAMFVELGEYSQNMLTDAFWTLNIALSQFDEYSQEATIFAEYSQLCSRTIVKNGLQVNITVKGKGNWLIVAQAFRWLPDYRMWLFSRRNVPFAPSLVLRPRQPWTDGD